MVTSMTGAPDILLGAEVMAEEAVSYAGVVGDIRAG